jgi:hypothetical protein
MNTGNVYPKEWKNIISFWLPAFSKEKVRASGNFIERA